MKTTKMSLGDITRKIPQLLAFGLILCFFMSLVGLVSAWGIPWAGIDLTADSYTHKVNEYGTVTVKVDAEDFAAGVIFYQLFIPSDVMYVSMVKGPTPTQYVYLKKGQCIKRIIPGPLENYCGPGTVLYWGDPSQIFLGQYRQSPKIKVKYTKAGSQTIRASANLQSSFYKIPAGDYITVKVK
ncbi:MAG: hypothetical protein WAX07_01805 [Candidatus Altiarchaeia archaeon]